MKHTWSLLFFYLFSPFCFAQEVLPLKTSPALRGLLAAKKNNDLLEVLLSVKDISVLVKRKIPVLAQYQPSGVALVKLTQAQLDALLQESEVIFADVRRKPKEELTTGAFDISLNNVNFSHRQFPEINGDSIFVSIKEQQFDSTDIDIKGRLFNSGVGSPTQTTHASIMATSLGGAGNSSPYAKGAAWGSYLTSSSFANLLPDPDTVYRKYNITVQNHSYGTGIENYYGGDAAAYDQNSRNLPSLIHIFSAGNVGNTAPITGTYAGLQGYANLTGSFKMSKNSISVGATDSFNHVVVLSSKGPAYDGRVKPELVAFAEEGTSGAAALVSGSVALVQQAYKSVGHSVAPSNALVKAILLNSADDVERPQIDYSSGYGALNTYRAVNTVREKRYREDSVAQNGEKLFPVTIPVGISLAKITISWTDVPGLPNAEKALVNDLDAELLLPVAGERWLPWVLSSVSNLDSLKLTAKRRKDTLNNTEQITLENPKPGNYLLQVKGSKILPGTSQAFALVYQFDTAATFKFTHPTSTDALPAKTSQVIRWQTTINDTASLDYSVDGVQWQTIVDGIHLKDNSFRWVTPDTNTFCFLRMRTKTQAEAVISDSLIISRMVNLKVGFNCIDSFMLFWNRLPVTQYQLYQLGEKYLQPVFRVADTIASLQKRQFQTLHYSVAPLIANKVGFRSFTINYATQGVGCYVSSFLASLQNSAALLDIQLGSVYGIKSISIIRRNGVGSTVIQTISPPLTTSFFINDPALASGVNYYQLALTLSNGQTVYSNIESVYFFPTTPVIFYPNPAVQNTPIQMIAQTPGEYSIIVYDVNGRKILSRLLEDVTQQLPPFSLSKGLYFVTVTSPNGSRYTQKLIVL